MLSKLRKLELQLRLPPVLLWSWFVWQQIGQEFYELRQGNFSSIISEALSAGVFVLVLELIFQLSPGEREATPLIWLFLLFWISGEMAARILLLDTFREPYTTLTLIAFGITWFLVAKDVKAIWALIRSSSEPNTDSDSESSER